MYSEQQYAGAPYPDPNYTGAGVYPVSQTPGGGGYPRSHSPRTVSTPTHVTNSRRKSCNLRTLG